MEKSSNLGLIILISGLLLLIVSIIINHNIDTSDTLNIINMVRLCSEMQSKKDYNI